MIICTNVISIHALLAESDPPLTSRAKTILAISIHALLAESDLFFCRDAPESRYFYPRSPCGERHYFSAVMRQNPGISIHALLAESDVSIIQLIE